MSERFVRWGGNALAFLYLTFLVSPWLFSLWTVLNRLFS